jgi:hypothetical protein
MGTGSKEPRGVRGPRGSSGGSSGHEPRREPQHRNAFERISYPWLVRMLAVPRWLVVVLIASSLLLGLVLSDGLAWLGSIFLLFVALFLAWLLALSWPALTGGRRFIRLLAVVGILGIAFLKLTGRF